MDKHKAGNKALAEPRNGFEDENTEQEMNMVKQRLEELVGQRAQAVQRREALVEELENAKRQVAVFDGAILAYQEMAKAEENQPPQDEAERA